MFPPLCYVVLDITGFLERSVSSLMDLKKIKLPVVTFKIKHPLVEMMNLEDLAGE